MEKLDFTFKPTLEHMALVKIVTVLWNRGDIRNCLTSETLKSNSCAEGDIDPHIACETEDFLHQDSENENDSFMSESMDDSVLHNGTVDQNNLSFDLYNTRFERLDAWQKIENMVIEKGLGLLLPEPLKLKVISCIKPIGLEILKWLENHFEIKYLAIKLPLEFFWTSRGTIDKKKTAEALIKDENICITKRYKLACIYCLENDIKILRDKISQLNWFTSFDYVPDDSYSELVRIWGCILKGKMSDLPHENHGNACTPYQYAFEAAAQYGQKAATEYFYQKLTLVERKESFIRITDYVIDGLSEDNAWELDFSLKDHGDVLRFLVSQMDSQQLAETFKKSLTLGWIVLECCLDWPWQGFILKTARYVQEFLDEDDYEGILYIIIGKIINGFKDCNYQILFREFYQFIPKTHKRYFYVCRRGYDIRLALPASLLPSLFRIKDKENISLILKDATAAEKEKIIFCKQSKDICVDLACKNERDLLLFFVTECIASRDKLMQFGKEIASHLEGETAEVKELCFSCFHLLDNVI